MKIRCCVLLFVLILSAGCTAPKTALKEPAMFASIEDYRFGPEGGVDLVWSTRRISDSATLRTTLQKYDSLSLGQTWVVVDKNSSRNLDDKQILQISEHMIKVIKARLGHGFKLVDTPTDKTLRLSIALTNIETSNPVLLMTNGLLPVGFSTSSVSRIVAGEHSSLDSTAVELLVSDAKTNEPLIATIDKSFSNRDVGTMLATQETAKESVSLWADRLWVTLNYWNWIKKRTSAPL